MPPGPAARWAYLIGEVVGAVVAVGLIDLVQTLPTRQERESAEGSALPM